MMNKKLNLFWGLFIITLIFIGVESGSLFYANRVAKKDTEHLLMHTMDVYLAAVNPERIKTLKTVPSDIETADYIRLKEQSTLLVKPFNNDGIDSIYVMKNKDNQIYFLVDSLPTTSPRYSSPGTAYIQPPAGLQTVFTSNNEALLGPYTDEYGTFISFFKPIITLSDQQVVGVAGVDMDYSVYQTHLWHDYSTTTYLVLLLYAMAILLYLYFRKRKLSALELSTAQALTKNLLDTLPDIFYVLDEKGKFILWNKSLVKVSGYTDQELKNLNATNFFTNKDKNKYLEAITKIKSSGYDLAQFDLRNKRGKTTPFELQSTRLYDDEGKFIGIAGSGRNISQRQKQEQELAEHAAEIDKMNKFMIGREIRMQELKKEIEELKKKTTKT